MSKFYVDDNYNETIEQIRTQISNNRIWVIIGETTDIEGRFIASVIISTLKIERSGTIFLLHSEQLEKIYFTTVSKVADKSMTELWPEGKGHDHILLFLTDAAPYIKKDGKLFKVFCSKMMHVIYAVHCLHRIA